MPRRYDSSPDYSPSLAARLAEMFSSVGDASGVFGKYLAGAEEREAQRQNQALQRFLGFKQLESLDADRKLKHDEFTAGQEAKRTERADKAAIERRRREALAAGFSTPGTPYEQLLEIPGDPGPQATAPPEMSDVQGATPWEPPRDPLVAFLKGKRRPSYPQVFEHLGKRGMLADLGKDDYGAIEKGFPEPDPGKIAQGIKNVSESNVKDPHALVRLLWPDMAGDVEFRSGGGTALKPTGGMQDRLLAGGYKNLEDVPASAYGEAQQAAEKATRVGDSECSGASAPTARRRPGQQPRTAACRGGSGEAQRGAVKDWLAGRGTGHARTGKSWRDSDGAVYFSARRGFERDDAGSGEGAGRGDRSRERGA